MYRCAQYHLSGCNGQIKVDINMETSPWKDHSCLGAKGPDEHEVILESVSTDTSKYSTKDLMVRHHLDVSNDKLVKRIAQRRRRHKKRAAVFSTQTITETAVLPPSPIFKR